VVLQEIWPAQITAVVNHSGPIVSALSKTLRADMHNAAVQECFSEKYQWTEEIWERIDHPSVAMALKKLPLTDRRRVTQLPSQWLPVNSRLAKFMQDRYPFSHLLCCQSGDPNVLTWLESDFQKLLQKMETPQMISRS
jgi:hypothetical protein